MIPTTNLTTSSAADPTSLPKANKGSGRAGAGRQKEKSEFKSNLDDQLAQAGGIEGAQANVAAMMAAQSHARPNHAAAPKPGLDANPGEEQEQGARAGSMPSLQRPGKELMARMDQAEYSPLTARVASSVNAASSIAGLKPWNQDWVFEGNPKATAEVKPLFGKSNEELELAQMQEALKQLRAQVSAPGSKSPAQVSQNLRPGSQTRGDSNAVAPGAMVEANPEERMHMAQVSGVLAGNLASQLKAMNGNMSEVGVRGPRREPGAEKSASGAQLAKGNGLSGAEFMNTLSMMRPDASGGAQRGGGSSQQDPGNGRERSRPELKVVDSTPATFGSVHSFQSSQAQTASPPMHLTGHVVPGAMAQDRLSHEAILGMSNGIRNMSVQGGGEMRIRLRPENLGELHLRVVTQGGEVGLEIMASDDKAKKILQDSLSSLKDSLASHQLTLGKVEFSVAQSAGSHQSQNDSSGQQQQQQASSAQQQFNQAALGQNAGDGRNQRSNPWNDPESDVNLARPMRPIGQARMAAGAVSGAMGARSANGRLDVRA